MPVLLIWPMFVTIKNSSALWHFLGQYKTNSFQFPPLNPLHGFAINSSIAKFRFVCFSNEEVGALVLANLFMWMCVWPLECIRFPLEERDSHNHTHTHTAKHSMWHRIELSSKRFPWRRKHLILPLAKELECRMNWRIADVCW